VNAVVRLVVVVPMIVGLRVRSVAPALHVGNRFEIVRYRVGPALGTAPDSDGSSDARRTSAARRHLLLLIRRGRSEWSGGPRGKSVSAARGEPAGNLIAAQYSAVKRSDE
jgi:hypothetical protein